jgi:hypothetical protein
MILQEAYASVTVLPPMDMFLTKRPMLVGGGRRSVKGRRLTED